MLELRRCSRRLLLTGTPISNNARELLALLAFLNPKLFSNDGSVRELFGAVERQADERTLSRVKEMVAPFVLRRLKTQAVAQSSDSHHMAIGRESDCDQAVVASQVLHALPPKSEETLHVPMGEAQAAQYERTLKRITDEASARQIAADAAIAAEAAGPAGAAAAVGDGLDRSWIQNAFCELRKAAVHPALQLEHYAPMLPRLARVLHCEGEFGEQCTEARVLKELKTESGTRRIRNHAHAAPRSHGHVS